MFSVVFVTHHREVSVLRRVRSEAIIEIMRELQQSGVAVLQGGGSPNR